jgi:hypothetical protein
MKSIPNDGSPREKMLLLPSSASFKARPQGTVDLPRDGELDPAPTRCRDWLFRSVGLQRYEDRCHG